MSEAASKTDDALSNDVARHDVSEDGVTWRPHDPERDKTAPVLHKRIVFAPPPQN